LQTDSNNYGGAAQDLPHFEYAVVNSKMVYLG